MRCTRGRVIEVTSLDDFEHRLALGATSMQGWRVCGVDLRSHHDALRSRAVEGALFVGCTFAVGDIDRVRAGGALVLPALDEVPVDVRRTSLYAVEDLYDAPDYEESLDARAYAWSRRTHDRDDTLARAVHDHAIDQALEDWIAGRSLVGVMGGHALQRDDPAYAEAARLGHLVGDRHVVTTGGGPGAMEAANLGARLSDHPPEALADAIARLSTCPTFSPSIQSWADVAREVCQTYGEPSESLGIPTWHYGHEPPNVFATAIAKYFRNATREAILLEICDAGIVFLPGAGGTVQEVFQDACENYYADESSVAPMVLVGVDYWTDTLPVWPLLHRLAQGRAMEEHIHLVATVEDAAALVANSG